MPTLDEWKLVLEGRSQLDKSEFSHFIPRNGDQKFLQVAFGELPNGQIFISKLNRLMNENANTSTYVLPKAENYLSKQAITDLARAYKRNIRSFFQETGSTAEFEQANIDAVEYVHSNRAFMSRRMDDGLEPTDIEDELQFQFGRNFKEVGKYLYVLEEACHSLTTYPAITRWLLLDLAWITSLFTNFGKLVVI